MASALTRNAVDLPDDIFIMIFTTLKSHMPEHTWSASLTRKSSVWIYVTHVCRRWRQISLGCATLWAAVSSFQIHDQIRAYLGRSNGAPLDAFINLTGTKKFPATNSPSPNLSSIIILRELPRIRMLTVRINGSSHYEVDETLKPLFDQPTTLLQTLHLTTVIPCLKPISIFQRSHPALKSVQFVDCFMPWDCGIFQDLTILRILRPNRQPDLSQYHTLLSSCPNLQELSLMDAGPDLTHTSRLLSKPILALRYLRKLGILMDAYQCMAFFALLSLPTGVRFTIGCNRIPLNSPIIVIPKVLTAIPYPGDSFLSITVARNTLVVTQGLTPNTRSVMFDWALGDSNSAAVFHLIATYMTECDWAVASVININFRRCVYAGNMNMWIELLDVMPNAQNLNITVDSCSEHPENGLPEALASLRPSESGGATFAVPNLVRLALINFDFSDASGVYGACFQSRHEIFPLSNLVLQNCKKFDMGLLEKFVGEVTVI
ncbi:hypothetical protein BD410DRAFT_830674 [Rickenella mellea]|uniref:Uncharacterized protein n=1 Tax=Rickenella mellea TaxID=50990 RepID=A0A4Y7PU67_9AGAM|nr:hypothetical protein BD410DRAFT_830674 [Rickenella mellea]